MLFVKSATHAIIGQKEAMEVVVVIVEVVAVIVEVVVVVVEVRAVVVVAVQALIEAAVEVTNLSEVMVAVL